MKKNLSLGQNSHNSHTQNSDEILPYLNFELDESLSKNFSVQNDVPPFVKGIQFDAADILEHSAKQVIHLSDPTLIDARVEQSKDRADLSTARKDLLRVPDWKRTIAQESHFRNQTRNLNGQTKFTASVATDRIMAESALAAARSNFLNGPNTQRAQSQAQEAAAAAMRNLTRANFIQGAETQRTLAEARKIDMDRRINLAMAIGRGIILLTVVTVFLRYFR